MRARDPDGRRRRRPRGFGDRGKDVDQSDRDPDAGPRAARTRKLHEERHADRLAVKEDAVLVLAVVAEPLPVIRGEHDDRAVVETALPQVSEETADRCVGRGDLSVVGARRVLGAECLRRNVGSVRLVEVKEEKERLSRVGLREGFKTLYGLGARPLVRRVRSEHVVVKVETGIEPTIATEGEGGDGRARRVAARLQHRRECRMRTRQPVPHVVADAVLRRQEPGQERRVRRKRQWRRAVRVLENDRVARERV